jgi:SRSO17 transposase
MDVHASPETLPELQTFLDNFQVRFRRPEAKTALERYTTGLLTELPNKNCDTMAQAVPGTSEQRLQGFLTRMDWDEEDLNRQRVQWLTAMATIGDGVLLLDDTGFAKQGKASVGVARQYSGTLGKVGNCQVAVTCCYSDPLATWPVGVRLYLPETWTQDLERCRQAGVPPEVGFQTKPEIALALLDQARTWGVPHHCVVTDADYGDNPNFLAGLEDRGEPYVVGVRADFRVGLATRALRASRGRAMPTKPGLTRLEHEELGMRLKQLRDEALHIALLLETAYAKQSPCARLSYRAAQTVDRLRSALDRQAFLDYCQWEAHEKVQFKGSRTYYSGNDARTDD